MYYFEGKDYSKDPSTEDQKSFDRLLEEQLAEFQKAAGEGRALRHKAGVRVSLIQFRPMGLLQISFSKAVMCERTHHPPELLIMIIFYFLMFFTTPNTSTGAASGQKVLFKALM